MIDKWVTSFRFNERKNKEKFSIGFLIDFICCRLPRKWRQSAESVRLPCRFFSKLCMRVVDKKVNYAGLLCCRDCNNSQTTPGITMHELPPNRPAVRRKWIKFIQFKRADFLTAPHHAHLCSEHFSECDFANPMEYRMSKLTRCSGTLSKSCLIGSNWYGCILVGLSGKVSVSSSELELAILQRLPRVT